MTNEVDRLAAALGPNAGYSEAERMLGDLLTRDLISGTAIRVARDHMMQFARKALSTPTATERVNRDAAIREVVGLCNCIPGSTQWNAAEFMYDYLTKHWPTNPAAPTPLPKCPVCGKGPSDKDDARGWCTGCSENVPDTTEAPLSALQRLGQEFEAGEHWSRQQIVNRVLDAITEHFLSNGKVFAVAAGKAADDILALLRPCFAPSLTEEPAQEEAVDPCPNGEHCCCCGPGDVCCDCGQTLIDLDRNIALERWRDFLDDNPDDLTSPEDLPDHALVTFEQFFGMARDILPRLTVTLTNASTPADHGEDGHAED